MQKNLLQIEDSALLNPTAFQGDKGIVFENIFRIKEGKKYIAQLSLNFILSHIG